MNDRVTPEEDAAMTTKSCLWTYDDIDNYYTTACGESFVFTDEGLKSNKFVFCPYCGGTIQEKR